MIVPVKFLTPLMLDVRTSTWGTTLNGFLAWDSQRPMEVDMAVFDVNTRTPHYTWTILRSRMIDVLSNRLPPSVYPMTEDSFDLYYVEKPPTMREPAIVLHGQKDFLKSQRYYEIFCPAEAAAEVLLRAGNLIPPGSPEDTYASEFLDTELGKLLK